MVTSLIDSRNLYSYALIFSCVILLIMYQCTRINLNCILSKKNIPCKKNTGGLNVIYYNTIKWITIFNISSLATGINTLTVSFLCNVLFALLLWLTIYSEKLEYNEIIFHKEILITMNRLLMSVYITILEFVAINIRWCTLGVRLRVNVIVGHVFLRILHRLRNSILPWILITPYRTVEIILYSIQRIIFTLLLMVY